MAKTLVLFRHADKTPDGRHISAEGRHQAFKVGYHTSGKVDHMFFGPLIRTAETAYAMMTGNPAFDETVIHDPIDGLGSDELFAQMVTSQVKIKIREGASNLEAVTSSHDIDALAGFMSDGKHALQQMLDAMDDGQLGFGIFHDPTIPLLGRFLGLPEARSLGSVEAVVFRQEDNGRITASWD